MHALIEYLKHGDDSVSRTELENNLETKLSDRRFTADIGPLLADGYTWDVEAAADSVRTQLIGRMPARGIPGTP